MSAPYLLVFSSILYTIILSLVLLIYYYLYPRKRISLLSLLILISLLPVISLLRPGSYESGDLSTHIMESIYFFKLLGQGNLFPIWGGEMNATYGYPAFLFTYPLPFYLSSLFHLLGFSFVNSVKMLLATSYILSGVFMFLFLKKHVKEYAAFVGALLYLFAPYHLVDLHFRADIGEIVAFAFLPLVLLAARNVIADGSVRWFIVEMLSLSALIISHPAISLSGFLVIALYILIFIRNVSQEGKKKIFFIQIFCFIVAILLTSFYWLPVLGELPYTLNHSLSRNVIFLSFTDLLISSWRYGLLFQGPQGQLSFILGYPHLLILILSILLLFKLKISASERRIYLLSLAIIVAAIFLMTDVSKPLWEIIPFLKSFQFSYRLLGVTIFAISILGAVLVNISKKKHILYFFCLFIILSTILNWGNRKNIPELTDSELQKQIPYTATNGAGLGQAVPKWSDPNQTFTEKIPTHHLEIIKGKGTIYEQIRTNVYHKYVVQADTQLLVRENTLYFPGWEALVDQKPQPVTPSLSAKPRGVMTFSISPGSHIVEVIFKDTIFVSLGKSISGITLIIVATSLLFLNYRKSITKKKRKK